MDLNLKGKKALVTGSSRGIGRAVVETLLKEGVEVWGLCSHESEAKPALETLAVENQTAFHEVWADCGNGDELKSVVSAALSEAGGFDILVNNAGITKDTLSFRMKTEDWQRVLDVNLTAAFITAQIISNDMIHKKSGSIINMSSIIGVRGGAGQVNYAASKAGLIGYTKSLAKEVGSRNVRVNAIAPGYVETDMTKAVNEKAREAWLQMIPLKRAALPQDIANAVLFLASDLSTYITGQVIGVDGGM